ncbi:two-component transcriptional regulator [Leptolyngbya boryana NIES-2135]|jgi:diguanylate cyclase (GGDEF)-like protein|uniref:Two-component transcriptional regulator n=1 Tax=Leptolyngbya boryana NIES-2135 TaxID=1973484 RepID=A0A1Z4JC14_LEPBY|nr:MULTISPECIES: response regulator [Leptolyngbya]BAY54314.1 two-component transcriptional regulator [Leptolyngbya boryana NIES-2135]MBD2370818.1 response regulator [Leptolyngbya sp. FACHB-161]MBD2377184.1 response regulator [Leptolyngbya sp. FACHB-238]MBD2401606.1 response regulator [Leptolyngbya sp. FACHB-239]MBD2408159.1 response regulator [Leptolyngbya sp. FACHB-402]
MRILVIEDDELTAQALTTILTAHHYAVEVAKDGKSGLALLDSFEYDLLILDVGLPDLNGIEVCRQVRSAAPTPDKPHTPQLPILLLTAYQSPHDRALGLDAGADDYVVKPFDEEELVARIRALLRRASSTGAPMLEWGDLELNPSSCEVSYGSTPLILTPKEYGLLELFLRNSRRVFSCGNILEHLWAYDAPGEEAVRTHIKGLRQKLKAVGAPADFIETVYGIGYRLKPLSNAALLTSTIPTSVEQEVRSKLGAVWTSYKERINEQIAIIERVACESDWTLQASATRQAHTLAGALGTFGFTEGSQIARNIEQILAGCPLKPRALTQLQELLATLRRVIDVPASSSAPICPEVTPAIANLATVQLPSILVISQDRDFLDALESEFLLWNYQCTIATTAKAVIKICQNDAPSLVLLDLDCFDSIATSMALLTSLQQCCSTIPTIVLTSHNELTERLEVSRHGGRLLLQKTTPIPQVLEAVSQVLQRALPTPSKILVVDDDIALLDALTVLLSPWGLKVYTLNDPHRFWETLETVSPDVLVLDLEFPDFKGIELCQVVRNDLHWHHLPVVILTAHSESETISQVFAAGADDFVSKPIVGAELVARILNRLERVRLVRQILDTDPLTGVMNRQKSTQELEAFLRSSDRSHQSVAIAVIDVDHLRSVNAQYGHAAGDAVLRQFGHLLQQSFCSEDIVARWGGEEFVIGMYGVTREDGVQRLMQVLERLNQQALTTENGEIVHVSFSAGVAQYPEDGKDLKTLYRTADLALRQAKRLREETHSQHTISSILPAESDVVLKS